MKNSVLIIFILLLCFSVDSCIPGSARPMRAYVYNDVTPANGYGAYAYVLLSSGFTSVTGANYRRSLQTANSFLENFPLPDGYRNKEKRGDLMITHWLIRKNKRISENGETLLNEYDFSRALSMLSAIKMSDKQGPVLVAWKKPFETLSATEMRQCIIFDLSRFSNEDIDRAFKLWRRMLSQDVNQWNRSGNKLLKFREEVRNSFQQYGQTLFDLISF